MRIIFLDIDGVVTSLRTGWHNLDIYTINFLRWVCKKADVKIVISSTWRMNHNADYWKNIFGEYIHKDYRTPIGRELASIRDNLCRGNEIQLWLSEHPEVTKYLILDDDSDMLEFQMNSFIKTDTFNGLLHEHMEQIRNYWEIDGFWQGHREEDYRLHTCDQMFSWYNLKKY